MPDYDSSNYDPPAPVAQVILRDINTGASFPGVFLLIDSGADVTLLPKSAIETLGLKPIEGAGYQLLGFDGTISTAQAVDLDMIFLKKAYRGRYLLTGATHGVLGRDVLSNVNILLEGPRRQWSEYPTAP